MIVRSILLITLALVAAPAPAKDPSTCYGTTSNGRLENGWKLPANGRNFSAYSLLGRTLGRTYVHSTVHGIVLDAYEATARTLPDRVFVYGETGKKRGGEFPPHKTHRNGLSVDFMTPVLDQSGQSVPLPASMLNQWGYDIEFDTGGRHDGLTIDAEAIAEHLYQLHRAAQSRGVDIWRVIFDPALQPLLHATKRWRYLEQNVAFSSTRSWVRHDDHYHVDFRVPCEPSS